jgi:hypothetical protein
MLCAGRFSGNESAMSVASDNCWHCPWCLEPVAENTAARGLLQCRKCNKFFDYWQDDSRGVTWFVSDPQADTTSPTEKNV